MENYAEKIKTADVAIKAAQDLGMYHVAQQIMDEKGRLTRAAKSPVELRVTYHLVPKYRTTERKPFEPTDLPIRSAKQEIDWFRNANSNVTVKVIRWGDPYVAPFTRTRIMLTGTDPINGTLMRGYIYMRKKEQQPCECHGLPTFDCINTFIQENGL